MPSNLTLAFYNPVSLSYGGGGERWVLEVAERLLARGHEVNVFTTGWNPSGARSDPASFENVNLIEMRYIKFLRGFALPSALDLHLLIREFNNSDVVYFYVYSPNELMAWALRHVLRTPLIGGFHTFLAPGRFLLHELYSPLFKKALSAFKGLHVLNRSTNNLMNDWGYMNTYFIPNGVDTDVFKLGNLIGDKSFNVLFTGRLTEDKGVDILLEIIRYVNEKLDIRDITFTICGSGPMKNHVEKVAKKYVNVDYLGFVPLENFPQIYANADLFLIPSKSEGMPLRLLEAQSCGLPVVGSRIPGILDVITAGDNGALINVGDVKGFAKAMKRYWEFWSFSSEEYYQLKREIREKIVKNYEWDMIISKLEQMFRISTFS